MGCWTHCPMVVSPLELSIKEVFVGEPEKWTIMDNIVSMGKCILSPSESTYKQNFGLQPFCSLGIAIAWSLV